MAMTALLQLIKCGQSYWLDNLTRRKITSGELNKRVVLQGLRGVTSNPAIFDKAISGGDDYDAQLQQLVHAGCEVHEIYERLVISDIQDACDILRPVYDGSDGEDGFVSLEVSPYLAHDTAETMAEARHLWNAVARPNVCIKILAPRRAYLLSRRCCTKVSISTSLYSSPSKTMRPWPRHTLRHWNGA